MLKSLKIRPIKDRLGLSSGFTLAEVLITLVIIGVIAAMTVPAIIQQTQKQEYVAGLKKAYSVLQNALYKMADNNGYPHGDYTYLNNLDFIDEFAKVANVIKKCNTANICMENGKTIESMHFKLLNGNNSNGLYARKTVILSDGQMYTYAKGADVSKYGLSSQDNENVIGRIIVDLNGSKKPNQVGYDIYFFYVVQDKGVVPAGSGNNSGDCRKSSSGYTCAAKVLKESKISY